MFFAIQGPLLLLEALLGEARRRAGLHLPRPLKTATTVAVLHSCERHTCLQICCCLQPPLLERAAAAAADPVPDHRCTWVPLPAAALHCSGAVAVLSRPGGGWDPAPPAAAALARRQQVPCPAVTPASRQPIGFAASVQEWNVGTALHVQWRRGRRSM